MSFDPFIPTTAKTTEEILQVLSTGSHMTGGGCLLIFLMMLANSSPNDPELDQNLFFLFSTTAGLEGLGLLFSGLAPLTRKQTTLSKREQVDSAGRILLGTGLASIPSLYLFQNVAGRRSLASISAFSILSMAVGSITLGLAQDKGNLVKW